MYQENFLPEMGPDKDLVHKEPEAVPVEDTQVIKESEAEEDVDEDCPVCGGTGPCNSCESGKRRTAEFKREALAKKYRK